MSRKIKNVPTSPLLENATDNNVGTKVGTNLASLGTDCISRQQAIDALKRKQDDGKGDLSRFYNTIIQHDIEAIMQLPLIQPKRGRWIRTGSGSLYDHYECSECGKAPKWECMGDNRWKIAFTDFCPNCGAKMEVNHEID